MTTAILSALPEEQSGLLDHLQQPRRVEHAGRAFWLGSLYGQPVVLALSGIGKVAAATTAAALIERFGSSAGRCRAIQACACPAMPDCLLIFSEL